MHPDNFVINDKGTLILVDLPHVMDMARDWTNVRCHKDRIWDAPETQHLPLWLDKSVPRVPQSVFGTRSDVWPFGVLTYECLVGAAAAGAGAA